MKGIAHFVTGVAIATCFPEVVRQAAGGGLLPVLGGVAGILPDTLDFRFVRYLERYDLEIDPGPEPDAGEIAERVAGAMRRAYETGKPQNVMLHTIRLGADLWRQYTIRFDPAHDEVAVRIGPIVNTSQVPLPGSEFPPLSSPPMGGTEGGTPMAGTEGETPPWETEGGTPLWGPEGGREARVKIGVPTAPTYDEENQIDIFSGPSFKFERRGDRLHVHFLDWHRRWSHSLTLAAALGLIGGLILGKWAGLVIGLGFVGHVLEDQLGFMGSNLFYPFSRRRSRGAQLLHSGDAAPNFLTVWTAVTVILFNLDRFSAQPRLDPLWFLGLAVALPVVVLGGVYQWQRRRERGRATEALQQGDIVAEMEEVEVG
jgi:membrane-bound metal-dependent hydrolase YbcI (DUF457 family)